MAQLCLLQGATFDQLYSFPSLNKIYLLEHKTTHFASSHLNNAQESFHFHHSFSCVSWWCAPDAPTARHHLWVLSCRNVRAPQKHPTSVFSTCILHPNVVFRKVLHRRGELITPDPGLINKLWRQMADFPLMLMCLDHNRGAGEDCRDFLPSDDWECNGSSLAGAFTQVHQHSMCKTNRRP